MQNRPKKPLTVRSFHRLLSVAIIAIVLLTALASPSLAQPKKKQADTKVTVKPGKIGRAHV